MKLGFSLSSGGLLLPYHLGVLDCLQANQFLNDNTPIAGASAGAIATASTACAIDSKLILDDTIEISNQCQQIGRARGKLAPLLRYQLEKRIDEDRFQTFQNRPGAAVLTYHEVFPSFKAVHQVDFEDKEDLINTVCHSSSFPFFTTDWPVSVDLSSSRRPSTIMILGTNKVPIQIPRLVVDGHFAVPGDRFGCPDFDLVTAAADKDDENAAGVKVDRTILVTVFPREMIGLKSGLPEWDCISPDLIGDGVEQCLDLLRLATQPSEPSELVALYDSGYADAEKWCRNEERRSRRTPATPASWDQPP